eukprot:TRINITY_DN4039_c0_g3_i3.p1 TRINITY_DN4039_c0_g3~~TRINITY_DN4039_c0_g3_i3.p1  ORF type:complete len:143 (+),score=17.41 TRINITY_DN4039_c0_g3_i3:96-524(+)
MSAAEAFKSSLLTFAKFGAAIHIVREYLFEISICIGPSMKPTFEGNGEFVIVEKISKRMGWLSRGDIVVCKSPLNAKEFVCKRIIGMPQDLLYADRRMSSLYQVGCLTDLFESHFELLVYGWIEVVFSHCWTRGSFSCLMVR